MKTLLFFATSLLALSLHPVCAAEGAREGGPAADRSPLARLGAMRETLGITEQQWEKLQPLLKQEGDRVREILADNTLSVEQKKAKARDATAEGREQIKEILTPEQRQKLGEEMKKSQGEPDRRLAELKEKLGLTEDQIGKLKPILEEEGPKLRALRENQALTPQERKDAFETSFGRIAALLEPAQAEKLREQMRARRN
jgi:Spy/CpxP family protein refolding chaperone